MAETAAEKKKREAQEKAKQKAQEEKAAQTNSTSGDGSKETGDVSSTVGNEVTDAQKAVDQANQAKAEEIAKPASEKSPEERTPDEIKAAAATAKAEVEQAQYDALKAAADKAQEEANSNDGDEDAYAKAAKFTEDTIKSKLEEGTTPKAQALEREDYVLKQQLYQQAGLSAPDVLATAGAAEKVRAG